MQLLVLLPLLVAIVAAMLLWPGWREAVGHIEAELHATIEREGWDLQVEFHEHGIEGLVAAVGERVEREIDPRARYLVMDSAGQRLAGNLAGWPADFAADADGYGHYLEPGGIRVEARQIELFGARRLLVGRVSPVTEFESALAGRLLAAALLLTVLAGSASLWFAWRLRRRLAHLLHEAEEIRRGDLSRQLVARGRGDEIDALTEAFNRVHGDLERLLHGARELGAHLAHDLKRPLQHGRRELEDALASAPAECRAALETSLLRLDELDATLGALLRLARIESGGLGRASENQRLDTVAGDAIEWLAPVAEAAGRRIESRLEACTLPGDRHLLFQLVQNLIENAIRHGAGVIEVGTRADGTLWVRDEGPGVPTEALPRLGQRFYRADPARGTPGSGIGLALARAIAEAHGGTLRFENLDPGFRVSVVRDPGPGTRDPVASSSRQAGG
jgi:signal transduction histidine kinase